MAFTLNREINIIDLLTLVSTVIGAIIIYSTITKVAADNQKRELDLSLAGELKNLVPIVANNYTNQLSEDGKSLQIKVYLRVKSELPTEVLHPSIEFYDHEGNKVDSNLYDAKDLGQTYGLFSPGSVYKITYNVDFKENSNPVKYRVALTYQYQLSKLIRERYRKVYNRTDEEIQMFNEITSLKTVYNERIYAYGGNDIWECFWTNPR